MYETRNRMNKSLRRIAVDKRLKVSVWIKYKAIILQCGTSFSWRIPFSLRAVSPAASKTGESANQSRSPHAQIIFDYIISQEIGKQFTLVIAVSLK